MNKIIKIISQKWFWYCVVMPIVITSVFWIGVFKTHDYIEARDKQLFNDGYEVGRFEQLNEDAEELANSCFDISENKELNILLKKYFKECKTAKTIWAIAQAESSGKQFAVGVNDNGTMDGGWLQVNSIHRRAGETQVAFIGRMHNLEENVSLASEVYKKQGFNAWVTYKTGKYKQYLK